MSVIRASVLVIVLVGLFVGFRIWQATEVEDEIVSVDEVPEKADVPIVSADIPIESAPQVEEQSLIDLDEDGCLTVKQLEELPELRQEVERFESVAASGDALNTYENLGAESIESFANQGDAAAMVVLGAMYVMRAYEMEDSQAIAWLNGKNTITDIHSGTDELPGKESLALNEAAYWFYEAASHGRVLALQQYGQVKGRLFGGPVGLGWISQSDYDALSMNEKNSLNPNNLFGQVAYDVAPALRDGAFGSVLSELSPTSSIQTEVREQLRIEFNQSLEDRDLPEIRVAAAETTSMEDLFDRVCESEKHEEIRRRSLE